MKKILLTLTTFFTSFEAMANQPKDWQLGFQEAASESMRDIISFHDNLLLPIIVAISAFVLFLMLYVCVKFRASGLAYFTFEKDTELSGKGPIGKFFTKEALQEIMNLTNAEVGDSIFLACGKQNELEKITSQARNKIAEDLDLINENVFAFCWIVDYPMFERDELTNKIEFSHNPFSMPQGDLTEKEFENPLELLAYQYDIVCNGIELSSGAIRNHKPELMYKLFSIAGYDKQQVDEKFSGMINAFSYGAPPHGGIAPGIDRIVMLLANEKNIREVTKFPLNQNAQDLMMNAPSEVNPEQLKELNLSLKNKK